MQLLEFAPLPLKLALLFVNSSLLLGLCLLLGLEGATGHCSSYPTQRSPNQCAFTGTCARCSTNDRASSCPQGGSTQGPLLSGRQRSSSTRKNEQGCRHTQALEGNSIGALSHNHRNLHFLDQGQSKSCTGRKMRQI